MAARFKQLESRAALVIALLALSVALGGNALATVATSGHRQIERGEIAKGAVTARALAKGAVTGKALGKHAVGAKSLRENAVGPKNLRENAVGPKALRGGSVGEAALATGAVTARVMAPNSVYGFALGPVETVATPIKDVDTTPDLSTWSNSSEEAAICPPGARLLSGGVGFTNPGNRRVGTILSLPSVNGGTNFWQGEITSDSGGLAEAQVQALCLKAGP